MKPVEISVFNRAINRAIARVQNKNISKFSTELVYSKYNLNSDFLAITSIDKHEILKISEIMYFKADGKCTLIYLKDGRKICSYKNLGEFDFISHKRNFFIRVSRSCILNFDFVIRVLKKVGCYCELENGDLISVSRRKEEDVKFFLKTYSVA